MPVSERGTVFDTVLTLFPEAISLVGDTNLSKTGPKFSKTGPKVGTRSEKPPRFTDLLGN